MAASVLLLHGFSGAPDSFAEVVENLAPDIEGSAPCLLGHSGHELVRGRWQQDFISAEHWIKSFEAEVDRLARWCVERAVRPKVLVGYSLGGRLGLGLLERHPALFESAILIGAHPGLNSEQERSERLALDAERLRILETRGVEGFMDYWQELPLFSSQRTLPIPTRERQAQIRRGHTATGLALSLRVCGLGAMPDYSLRLKRITTAVTLVVGAEDAQFKRIARNLAEELPSASLRVIEGTGHNPVLESPQPLADLISATAR